MNRIEESICFYTRNDYLLINDLLWGNSDNIEKVIKIIVENSKACMKEAEEIGIENRWRGGPERCHALYEAYQKRTPKDLTANAKTKLIVQAKNDIENLFAAMQPCKTQMLLYRNLRLKDIQEYRINQPLKTLGFSSCSKEKYNKPYGKDHQFIRFNIHIPENTLMLDLDNYPDWNNEQGEVLLPPFTARTERVFKSETPDCLYEVELTLLKTHKPEIKLNPNELFKTEPQK